MKFKFEHLAGRRVAVWGIGVEGLATLEALPVTAEVSILSDSPDDPNTCAIASRYGIQVRTPLEALSDNVPQIVVRSPGVSMRRHEIKALNDVGVVVTTLMELWIPFAPAGCVIGITGTKGKSTTTKLVAELIAASGRSVQIAGNMGIPVTNVESCDFAVVEVSSYQAAGIQISPHIGAITNLDVDHLPWHGSIDQYHRDKLQLFCNSGLERLVVPPWAESRVRELLPSLEFSAFQFEVGKVSELSRNGKLLADLRGTVLEPAHMVRNLAVACAVAEDALGSQLYAELVKEVVTEFSLPTGRLEVIPSQDAFTWVNDPLASNPFAASAAVLTYAAKPIVIILGGEDRGVDPTPVIDAINIHGRVRAVILLGPVGVVWESTIVNKTGLRAFQVETLELAVEVAAGQALPGDVILFSPAAPTPRLEGNWETRLTRFRESVQGLNQTFEI